MEGHVANRRDALLQYDVAVFVWLIYTYQFVGNRPYQVCFFLYVDSRLLL